MTAPNPPFDPAAVLALDARMPGLPACRIGQGWDRHRLAAMEAAVEAGGQPVRAMRLGGVAIDSRLGVIAHSDGDVLLHAITDALLAACGGPDLGSLFPDHSAEHAGRDSAEFLHAAAAIMRFRGWSLMNLDATVLLQSPRIGPQRAAIRSRIAKILGVSEVTIGVKGKSGEHVDAVGESRAVEAMAVVLIGRG